MKLVCVGWLQLNMTTNWQTSFCHHTHSVLLRCNLHTVNLHNGRRREGIAEGSGDVQWGEHTFYCAYMPTWAKKNTHTLTLPGTDCCLCSRLCQSQPDAVGVRLKRKKIEFSSADFKSSQMQQQKPPVKLAIFSIFLAVNSLVLHSSLQWCVCVSVCTQYFHKICLYRFFFFIFFQLSNPFLTSQQTPRMKLWNWMH